MGFCYQKNFVNPTLPVDEAQFYALVRATQWNENIDKYRETHDAALKRKLPAFIFQATFDETKSKAGKVGAWRKQSATRLTGLVVMDVDHVENPQEVHGEWLKVHDFNGLGILLVYITPSGQGLKIVFDRVQGSQGVGKPHRQPAPDGEAVGCEGGRELQGCKPHELHLQGNGYFVY